MKKNIKSKQELILIQLEFMFYFFSEMSINPWAEETGDKKREGKKKNGSPKMKSYVYNCSAVQIL